MILDASLLFILNVTLLLCSIICIYLGTNGKHSRRFQIRIYAIVVILVTIGVFVNYGGQSV